MWREVAWTEFSFPIYVIKFNLLYFSVVSAHPWTIHTPEEFVWGYPEPLFELAQNFMPNPPPLEKFGFFIEVCSGFVIFGNYAIQKMSEILSFKQCHKHTFCIEIEIVLCNLHCSLLIVYGKNSNQDRIFCDLSLSANHGKMGSSHEKIAGELRIFCTMDDQSGQHCPFPRCTTF